MTNRDRETIQFDSDCFQFIEDLADPDLFPDLPNLIPRRPPFDPDLPRPSRDDTPVGDLADDIATDFDFDPSQPFVA